MIHQENYKKKHQDRCEPQKTHKIERRVNAGARQRVASSELRSYQTLVSDLLQLLSGGEYQEKSTGIPTTPVHKTVRSSVSSTEQVRF